MHFISQKRYNPKTQSDEWYYRIKESFRDETGRVRCRVMLNVGFMEEKLASEDIRDIGKCLTYKYEHQGEKELFENVFSRYNDTVRRKTEEYWPKILEAGSIDTVKQIMEDSLSHAPSIHLRKGTIKRAQNKIKDKVFYFVCRA